MVDILRKADAHKWAQTIGALTAAGLVVGQILFGAGGMFANNASTAQTVADIKSQINGLVTVTAANQLKEQLNGLADQVRQLQTELRSAPRADQLIVLSNQIAEQRGHLDAMDTRLRDGANIIAGIQAELNMITRASNATLGKR